MPGILLRMGTAVGIVVAVVVMGALVAVYRASARNTFVRQAKLIEESWRGIDAELRERHELVRSLIGVLAGRAGYVAGQQGALTQLAAATAHAARASGQGALAQSRAEQNLTGALWHLVRVLPPDPQRPDSAYRQLGGGIAEREHRIAAAGRLHNGRVTAYNRRFDRLPSRLMRGTALRANPFAFAALGARTVPYPPTGRASTRPADGGYRVAPLAR